LITVRIRFEKTGEASYISLLDMQRVMQRVLKRSGVPVWYTLGFNPHIYMTFSCPLPLGQESLCESVDVKTEAESPDFAAWQTALNAVMPEGIRVYRVAEADKKADEIAFAAYTIRYSAAAAPLLEKYNSLDAAPIEKKSKHAVKTIDLKEYVSALTLSEDGDFVRFSLKLPASGSFNINPALLTKFCEDMFGLPASDAQVLRTALLTADGADF
jgi:radical SAM-linked protein